MNMSHEAGEGRGVQGEHNNNATREAIEWEQL
jgi:hypothetical protein